MSAPRTTIIECLDRIPGYVRLLGGQSIVEGFAVSLFARRHSEPVGFAPALRRVDNDVAVVVAQLIGVGTFARVQGVARTALLGEIRGIHQLVGLGVIAHEKTVARRLGRLNALRPWARGRG